MSGKLDKNNNIQDNYRQEAKERWGSSKEYLQSLEKTSEYSKEDWDKINSDRDRIFKAFAELMEEENAKDKTEELVIEWKEHITKYYYECSDDMLANLADMYVNDDRFKENIDKYKKGLAEFISDAIKDYFISVHRT